jgi:hypothetical protein
MQAKFSGNITIYPGYIFSGFAFRLVFMHSAAVNDGMAISSALVNGGRQDRDALPFQGFSCFVGKLSAWRDIQEDGGDEN